MLCLHFPYVFLSRSLFIVFCLLISLFLCPLFSFSLFLLVFVYHSLLSFSFFLSLYVQRKEGRYDSGIALRHPQLTPVASWSKARASRTFRHSDRGFESRSKQGCMPGFFCVVLSCVGRGFAMGLSPVQGVLPECLKGFTASEHKCESEQATGPNVSNL
jgi:hypothetical protein